MVDQTWLILYDGTPFLSYDYSVHYYCGNVISKQNISAQRTYTS